MGLAGLDYAAVLTRKRLRKGKRMPDFTCDLFGAATPLNHFWKHTLGSNHATVALRADWQRQLSRCHDELGFRYVRFHGLLSDDVGTLICHITLPPRAVAAVTVELAREQANGGMRA